MKTSIFLKVIECSGATKGFQNPKGKITAFAPTNEAMQAFFTAMSLTQQEVLSNELLCDALLRHHVSPLIITNSMVKRRSKAQTLEPYSYLTLQNPNGPLEVSDMQGNTAITLVGDVVAGEGILHVIDRVLQSGKSVQVGRQAAQCKDMNPSYRLLLDYETRMLHDMLAEHFASLCVCH
jgi:hypothetical protein